MLTAEAIPHIACIPLLRVADIALLWGGSA